MKLSKFKYKLPPELIALHPTPNRDEARLMVLDRKTGKIEHKVFKDVIDYFDEKDVFVFNDSKVFPARLYGNKEKTGRLKYRDLFGIILLGQHQHEAVIVQKQVKILDISRILYHIAIVVIFKTADAVDVDARYPAVAEQTFLVIHAVSVKQLNGVIRILAPLHDGDLLFHILVHPGLHAADQFLCQRKAAVGFNIIAFSEGKIHGNLLDLFHSTTS